MANLLVILGLLSSIAGIVGCILPLIPGPPLSFLGLILLSIARDWEPFSAVFLIVMAVLTVLVTILDYVIPALGARKYGASREGIWGSVFGMLAGTIFFPPFGMFLGAFLGAVIGELAAGKNDREALRAGWGVFVGTAAATVMKLAVSGVMLFYFIMELI